MRYLNLIGGGHKPAASGEWLESVDPASGRGWASVPASGRTDVDAAVGAAKAAFDGGPWRLLPDRERARLLRSLAQAFEQRIDEFADVEIRDNGRAYKESRGAFLPAVVEIINYFAGVADKIHGETVRLSPESFNYTLREPLGVVALVIPYNAPLTVLATKVAPALAAGNTVVVKPSEQASCSTLKFAELFAEAGFPDGVVNVVAGLGADVGEPLVTHPDVVKVALTGSASTARAISAEAAPHLKQLQFELGGKSPNVIFADADLDAAAEEAVAGVFTPSAGQSCIAGSRILIDRAVWDEVVGRILEKTKSIRLGDPGDPDTDMGPITFADQRDRVRSFIASVVSDGIELLYGGGDGKEGFPQGSPLRDGYFVEPTIFVTEDPSAVVCQEEIFGPVAVLTPFDDEEMALRLANDTRYGLASGVWTADLRRALRFVQGIQAGAVWVNAYRRTHWAVPFGGYKESGYGRDSGVESLREYQQVKTVWMQM